MTLPMTAAIALLLFTRFGPDIPFTRSLRHHLGERPARWLAERALRDVIFVGLTLGLLLASGQMWALLGPEFMFGYIADLSLYFDVLALAWLAGAVGGVRQAGRAVSAPMLRIVRRVTGRQPPASPRAHREARRPPASAANDNGEEERPAAVRPA